METKSEALFERAQKVIPGGVNSPVRAFRSVGRHPLFIERAEGQYIYDADGNRYTDYVGSWGPRILGHKAPVVQEAVLKALEGGLSFGAPTEREVLIAELITQHVPGVEMIRMVNSGTEAVMSAVRAARGFTGRSKIIKFEGCYHGHSDGMLVKAGSGVMTAGIPDSLGVPGGCAADTLTAVYNDLDSVEQLFQQHRGDVAAVILEPVAANMGVVLPKEGFLQKLRNMCDTNGALLIFDEVITGFRLAFGGAQEYFGVQADLVTYGKIIGGGMPVGAYGGRREIMETVAPLGGVYQAGTLSGNPVAMAAGLAQLRFLLDNPQVYGQIEQSCAYLVEGLQKAAAEAEVPLTVHQIGSLACLFFTGSPVDDYGSAKSSDTKRFARYFNAMLTRGHYFAPSQFEAIFLGYAHTKEDLDRTIQDARGVMKTI